MKIFNMHIIALLTLSFAFLFSSTLVAEETTKKRPNIIFALADDWSWPHASIAYDLKIPGSDSVIKTPNFDKIARQGVLFRNAFCSAPSCAASRAAMVTGRNMWELETAANLRGRFPNKFTPYTDALEKAGYHVGYMEKGVTPLAFKDRGNPAGTPYRSFAQFMSKRPADKPFCFWFGSHDAHRPYKKDSGVKSGMDPDKVVVPAALPNVDVVRRDLCDYYYEIQRFDRRLGEMLDLIEKKGELDNTMVVIAGDNGLPFPRCKVELYDSGTNIPLAIAWPASIKGGRVVDDFVSLAELAPTFMKAAGLKPLDTMTTKSFLNVLLSDKSGQVDPLRNKVFTGRGYHDYECRADDTGYPSRAIRTAEFLYIRNYEKDRWPSGDPVVFRKSRGKFGEVDPSPTKAYLEKHQNNPKVAEFYKLSMSKRPHEELYDLSKDPHQLNNLADNPEYAPILKKLKVDFEKEFGATYDPVALGIPARWDKSDSRRIR